MQCIEMFFILFSTCIVDSPQYHPPIVYSDGLLLLDIWVISSLLLYKLYCNEYLCACIFLYFDNVSVR